MEVEVKYPEIESIINKMVSLDEKIDELEKYAKDAAASCKAAEEELAALKEQILVPTFVTNLEKDTHWSQPGNTGNTGGPSSKPHGSYKLTPIDNYLNWSVQPASNYDAFYFFKNVRQSVQDATHIFEMEAKVRIKDLSKPMAFEYNLEDRKLTGSKRVNGGLQGLAGAGSATDKNTWRWWDVTIKEWVNLNIPFDKTFPAGQFNYVALELAYEPLGQWLTHVAFYINNTRYAINQSRKVPANDWPDANFLQYGFQIDTKLDITKKPLSCDMDTMDMNISWR